MSLLVTKDLPAVLLTGNPETLEFKKTGVYDNQGTKSEAVLEGSTLANDGDTFVLNLNDVTYTLTFKDAPDSSGWQLRSGAASGGSTAAFYANLAQDLACNVTLAQLYNFTVLTAPHRLRIVAKERTRYASIAGYDGTFAMSADITEGEDPELKFNYRVRVQLYVETAWNTNQYVQVWDGEGRGIPNVEGNFVSISIPDVPEVLSSWVQPTLPRETHAAVICKDNVRRYYYTYYEEFGTPTQPQKLYTSTKRLALLGKMPDTLLNATSAFVSRFRFASGKKPWLTSWTTDRLVTNEWQGWLGMLYSSFLDGANLAGTTHIRQLVTVYSVGGGTATITKDHAFFTDRLMIYPCGYEQLGLSGSDVVCWTVKLQRKVGSTYTDITEPLRFVLDTRYFRNTTYYLFTNLWSVPETLMSRGIDSKDRTVSGAVVEKTLQRDTDVETGVFAMTPRKGQDVWKKYTGYHSRAYNEWLDEFLESAYVWEVQLPAAATGVQQRYRAVVLTQDQYKRLQLDDFTWSLAWEMKYATAEINNGMGLPVIVESAGDDGGDGGGGTA